MSPSFPSVVSVPDFGDPWLYRDGFPFAALAALRETAAVHRLSSSTLEHDYWGVFRMREACEVLTNDADFISGNGVFPWNGPHFPDPSSQSILIACDGQRRIDVRDAMKNLFTRSAVDARRARLEVLLQQHLLPRLDGPVFDFAQEFAWPLSMEVTAHLLGITGPDADKLGEAVSGTLGDTLMEPDFRGYRARVAGSFAAAADILTGLLERQDPIDSGGLSAHLREHYRAGTLSRRDVLSNLIGVVVGGTEAPRLVLAGAGFLLAEQPDLLDRLRAEPGLLPGMAEEVLRWTSPTTMIGRTAVREVTIGEVAITPGDVVKVMVPAANHDPRQFFRPEVFDPTRRAQGSLIFGHGPHHCIGSLYAKEEVTMLLEFLAQHVRAIELAGPTARTRSSAFVGYLNVPVVLRGF